VLSITGKAEHPFVVLKQTLNQKKVKWRTVIGLGLRTGQNQGWLEGPWEFLGGIGSNFLGFKRANPPTFRKFLTQEIGWKKELGAKVQPRGELASYSRKLFLGVDTTIQLIQEVNSS